MKNLLQSVQDDIIKFLTSKKRFFFNERDLQMNLAVFLMEKGYDIEVEYRITKTDLQTKGCKYNWDEEIISIDLVVFYKESYIPIEIKYKTKELKQNSLNLDRFGEKISSKKVVRNQSAQDLGRYGFWKDVKRLELIHERYEKVVGGIALFVTNDGSYTYNPQKKDVGYYNFRILDNQTISGLLQWKNKGRDREVKDSPYCDIKLKYSYSPEWKQYTSSLGEKMYYVMLLVRNK